MTRHRVRPPLSDQELADLYEGNDWSLFVQEERDTATVELGCTLAPSEVTSIADLSAGGAQITPMIAKHYGVTPVLGDFGKRYRYPITGRIEETIETINPVDLFVCSETIEHLEDPDPVLVQIREKTKWLLLTTPVWEEPYLVSHGHLWTWRAEDVDEMLFASGFTLWEFRPVSLFGLWLAR